MLALARSTQRLPSDLLGPLPTSHVPHGHAIGHRQLQLYSYRYDRIDILILRLIYTALLVQHCELLIREDSDETAAHTNTRHRSDYNTGMWGVLYTLRLLCC